MPPPSVTTWIGQLKAGDHAAAERLWQEYFRRLVGLARAKLGDMPRRVADEEDVALSAFHSLCLGAERGKFPELNDRDNLWRLLATITGRKVLNLARDANRQKRGGGDVRGESAFLHANGDDDDSGGLGEVIGDSPTSDFACQLAEEYNRLLESLSNPELIAIARYRMEGYEYQEIADKIGKSPSTIERKLRIIRTLWEKAELVA
jgi:DNA-directed RNA polymerase specialized sigma24 family protein